MTLKWEKLFHERHDLLEFQFLQLFVAVFKTEIKATMADVKSEDIVNLKKSLNRRLDFLLERHAKYIDEIRQVYSEEIINTKKATNQQEAQIEVNQNVRGFWNNIIEKLKKQFD